MNYYSLLSFISFLKSSFSYYYFDIYYNGILKPPKTKNISKEKKHLKWKYKVIYSFLNGALRNTQSENIILD